VGDTWNLLSECEYPSILSGKKHVNIQIELFLGPLNLISSFSLFFYNFPLYVIVEHVWVSVLLPTCSTSRYMIYQLFVTTLFVAEEDAITTTWWGVYLFLQSCLVILKNSMKNLIVQILDEAQEMTQVVETYNIKMITNLTAINFILIVCMVFLLEY
ncbi:hypothetical protein ACJX0J_030558, partial [Zea mays]